MTDRNIRHCAHQRVPRRATALSPDNLLLDVPDVDLTSEGGHPLATTALERAIERNPEKVRRAFLTRDLWSPEDFEAEAAEQKARAQGRKG